MAAIALAESGGRTDVINDTPATRDYSVGLWQINYYGSLRAGRTASYGSPETLQGDPNAQAKAAIKLSGNGRNFTPWTTYTHNVYKQFMGPAVAGAAPASSGGGGLGLHTITDAGGAVVGAVSAGAGAVVNGASSGLDWLTGGAVGAVKTMGDAAVVFARFLGAVANPNLWRRLGLGLVGVLVVGLGLMLINRDAIGPAIKDAATAAAVA